MNRFHCYQIFLTYNDNSFIITQGVERLVTRNKLVRFSPKLIELAVAAIEQSS